MLTYEKVLEVFGEYLEEDKDCEVVNTSRGYTVLLWDTRMEGWGDVDVAPTPEKLRDVLLRHYDGYLFYKMSNKCKRDGLTEREQQEIEAKCRALWERCQ